MACIIFKIIDGVVVYLHHLSQSSFSHFHHGVVFMLSLRTWSMLALFSFITLVAGCASDGRSGASGKVTFKGGPLKTGQISFIPEGAMSPAGGAPIVDGAYSILPTAGLMPGKYKVAISSPETKAGPKEEMPGMSGPPPKETIPEKYNGKTELTAEIKAGAKNVFDFDLK